MNTLFAEVIETVASVFPAGGVPEPVAEKEEDEQPDVPAVYRLQKRLQEMQKSESEDLNNQLKELEERLNAEREVIRRFDEYDLATEAKKPDFDRSEATKLQSEALIAKEVARSISDEMGAVQQRLHSVSKEYGRRATKLTAYVQTLDETRRSTAIGFIKGKGKLMQDADWTRRWLAGVMNVEAGLYQMFPDEADWPTVAEMFDTLTRYTVPESTTEILYANLHKNHRDQFEKFAPDAEGEKA